MLERHKGSIEAREARFQNDKYLQLADQQQNPELIKAINDRIEAEREMNKAMAPVNAALIAFDIALTQMSTNMLRWAAGFNEDGTKKTEQQKAQETARALQAEAPVSELMVGVGDYSNVKTETQRQSGPIGNFWNWVFDVPDRDTPKQAAEFGNTTGLVAPKIDFTEQMRAMNDTSRTEAQQAENSRIVYSTPAPLAIPGATASPEAAKADAPSITVGDIKPTINVDARGMSSEEATKAVADGVRQGTAEGANAIVREAQAAQKNRYTN